jgi:hypothetical protein
VNVTIEPEHIVVAVEVMLTESTTDGLTVIVIGREVEVAGDAHDPDGVITQVTTLPFASVVEV